MTAARQRGRRHRRRRGARARRWARRASASKAEQLGAYGADVVSSSSTRRSSAYNARGRCGARSPSGSKPGGYRAAFFSASAQGRDLAPRVAAKLDVPLASDVTAFELERRRARWRSTRRTRQGDRHARGSPARRRSSRSGPARSRAASMPRAGTGRDRRSRPADPARVAGRRHGGRRSGRGAKLDLGEAPVIVSGGRGLKAAGELQAGRGSRRRVRQRGGGRDARRHRRRLAPHSDQIGQTGRQVSPHALRRGRHLRRDPASRRHAHVEDDRRDQQGQGRADLQGRGLRHRRATCSRSCRGSPRKSARRARSTEPASDFVERLPDLAADAERVARAALEEDGTRDVTTDWC